MPSTPARHFSLPPKPTNEPCIKAFDILCKSVGACESFHVLFRDSLVGRGTTTDAQQDTLRAMLVFACAGLDSSLKQLVNDALPSVIDRDKGAQETFTENVRRKLPDIEKSRDLLASVLTASNPRVSLLEKVVADLVADSLQSVAQLSKVAAAFNIKSSELGDMKALKEAFEARNQIIHEMDINFGTNRSRRPRKKSDMERLTKTVLDAAAGLLKKVDNTLSN